MAHLWRRHRTTPPRRSCGNARHGAGCWMGGWHCFGTSPWCSRPLQPWWQVLEKSTWSTSEMFLWSDVLITTGLPQSVADCMGSCPWAAVNHTAWTTSPSSSWRPSDRQDSSPLWKGTYRDQHQPQTQCRAMPEAARLSTPLDLEPGLGIQSLTFGDHGIFPQASCEAPQHCPQELLTPPGVSWRNPQAAASAGGRESRGCPLGAGGDCGHAGGSENLFS